MLAGMLVLTLAGCAAEPAPAPLSEKTAEAAASFSWRLFDAVREPEKNLILSPVSVLAAAGMCATGAKGETLSQLEAAAGMDVSAMNELAAAYASQSGVFESANSVWLRKDFQISDPQVLSTLETQYQAAVFTEPFNQSSCDKINKWVSEKTEGLISRMVREIPSSTQMVLLNAAAFDGGWTAPFDPEATDTAVFTGSSGTGEPVSMMHSTENTYVETDTLHGFMKPYGDGQYGFVALIPKEGGLLDDALKTLPENMEMSQREVYVSLPRFALDAEADLVPVMESLGATDLFDEKADLSGFGKGLYVSSLLQKARIIVDEKGTKAGAATEAGISEMSLAPDEPVTINCDRPFAYMVMDLEHNVPLFMGIVEKVSES